MLINAGSASASGNRCRRPAGQGPRRGHGLHQFRQGLSADHTALSESRNQTDHRPLFHPNGRSIQAEGIVPDILVERAQVTACHDNAGQITEADLSGHLGNSSAESDAKKTRASSARIAAELLASDNHCTRRWRC